VPSAHGAGPALNAPLSLTGTLGKSAAIHRKEQLPPGEAEPPPITRPIEAICAEIVARVAFVREHRRECGSLSQAIYSLPLVELHQLALHVERSRDTIEEAQGCLDTTTTTT
jgi:hypothetical protein